MKGLKMRIDTVGHSNSNEAYNWLVGRRVVEAHIQGVTMPKDPNDPYNNPWPPYAAGFIVLDDGTRAYIQPNEGCGGCTNGYYDLTYLCTVDNVITDVRLDREDNEQYEGNTYRIFVYAGNEEINLMTVDGSDGNGYYGTGYSITIYFP
jgi:hypothetical protein